MGRLMRRLTAFIAPQVPMWPHESQDNCFQDSLPCYQRAKNLCITNNNPSGQETASIFVSLHLSIHLCKILLLSFMLSKAMSFLVFEVDSQAISHDSSDAHKGVLFTISFFSTLWNMEPTSRDKNPWGIRHCHTLAPFRSSSPKSLPRSWWKLGQTTGHRKNTD